MTIDITLSREDIVEAILTWVKLRPEYPLIRKDIINVGWTGGSIVLRPSDLDKAPNCDE